MDKHEPESEPVFTPDRLEALLLDSKITLQKNKNYPEEFRAPLQTFKPIISSVMLEEINSSCKSAISSNDLDKFVKQFYTSYVSQAQSYFELGAQLANLLMKKFGERIMEYMNKNETSENPFDVPIKPKEMDVIQNLAGYVVKTFKRKFKKNPDCHESKLVLCILKEMVDNDDKKNQRLINALFTIFYDMLVVAEIMFRRVNFLKERKISCDKLAMDISKNTSVQHNFSKILSGVTVDVELSSNLLQKMLVHYVKVRTFSAARKITLKHRAENKKKKSKGLRKTMKMDEAVKQQHQ